MSDAAGLSTQRVVVINANGILHGLATASAESTVLNEGFNTISELEVTVLFGRLFLAIFVHEKNDCFSFSVLQVGTVKQRSLFLIWL